MRTKQYLLIGFLSVALLGLSTTFAIAADTWTWTEHPSVSVGETAVSTNGMKLISGGPNFLWTSADAGETWTQRTTVVRPWGPVASSADGTKLIAGSTSGSTSTVEGFLYTSNDSGVSWTQRVAAYPGETAGTFHPIGAHFWNSLAMSADGTKVVAADSGNYVGERPSYIYTSSDSGATWTAQTSIGDRSWASVAMNATGSRIVAAWGVSGGTEAYNGHTYTSTDGGATWTPRNFAGKRMSSVAMSSDGMKVVAVGGYPQLHVSNDGGATFTTLPITGIANPQNVSMSSDGSRIVVSTMPVASTISVSMDGGTTWSAQPSAGTRNWRTSIISGNGAKIFAGVFGTGDHLWTGVPTAACSITSFTATPTSVTSGGASSLAWNTTGCTSATISGGGMTGSKPLSSAGLTTGPLTATTTYTLSATGATGTVTAPVTVTVTTAPVCTIDSFKATPANVVSGAASMLSWNTTGCTSATISGGGMTGPKPLSSVGLTTGPLTTTTTYTLSATVGTSTVTKTVTVNVVGSTCKINSFTVTPSSVTSGSTATLTWSTTGCTSVKIVGGGLNTTFPPNSSVTTGILSATTTYKLTAY